VILLLLFWEFAKIGLFTIGGGMAALPFLYELSDKYPHWFSYADVTNMIAISESTPGPIGINAATYVGYHTAGVPGGFVATLGVVVPSLIIVSVVAAFLTRFQKNRFVQYSFTGIRPVVAALISAAFLSVFSMSVLIPSAGGFLGFGVEPAAAVLFAAALALMIRFKKHPVIYLAGGAVIGLLFGH
jgi:chromate transporter